MKKFLRFIGACTVVIAGTLCGGQAEARTCPASVLALQQHDSRIYLYYPTVQDPQFPAMGGGAVTTPLGAFDLSQLDSSIGAEAALLARVETLVKTGLCEFNVGVTTVRQPQLPSPTESHWQIVGIGSDGFSSPQAPVAQAEHISNSGDSDPQDYVRFWVADLGDWAQLGGELIGANSTLDRWATGMANIILHELGHNHGTGHADAGPRQGTTEDAAPNHFMSPLNAASPSAFVTALNHHSDTSYEALAHSVGLAAQTVHNWDFVNPNATSADSFTITLVAMQPGVTLTEGWVYSGPLSPWSNALIAPDGQRNFQGQTRDAFVVIFHTIKAWANGSTPGEVPPGALFHTGLSVHGGPFAVYDAVLSYQGAPLLLHPRMVDFAGTTGFRPGPPARPGFSIRLTNPVPARGPILVRDIDVRFSPRMIDIETMVSGAVPRGLDDRRAALYERTPSRDRPDIAGRETLRRRQFVVGADPISIPIAALSDPRHLMVEHHCPPPERERAPPQGRRPARPPWSDDLSTCSAGTSLSLFPATYVYVSATIVDPAARQWDARRRRMVTGPLATRVFFQVAGSVPDANRNGVDDLLDIRNGRSRDANRDGVPDEINRAPNREREPAPVPR